MHVRFTSSVGLPVTAEDAHEVLGTIAGIVVQPDTGAIEGCTVRTPGFFASGTLFLSTEDILHWGLRITVRHADVLGPAEDRVRLQSLLREERPVLGQAMRTESGQSLGRCSDLQFNTRDFRLEWLFPRRLLRWGPPVPVSRIVEVRTDAIIVRDTVLPAEESEEEAPVLPALPEAA